jgi:hypothetical protein
MSLVKRDCNTTAHKLAKLAIFDENSTGLLLHYRGEKNYSFVTTRKQAQGEEHTPRSPPQLGKGTLHAYIPVFTLLAIRTKSKSARMRLARAGAVRNSSSKILRHLSFHRSHMMYIERAMFFFL